METYLSHHGIKGQKWGVRRYQNPDGTLTAAGKKREDKKLKRNKKANKEAKSRLVDMKDSKVIGIEQKNGDILVLDKNDVIKLGPALAEKKVKELVAEQTRKREEQKKARKIIDNEAKKLVNDLLKDFNGDDEEYELLKELEYTYN